MHPESEHSQPAALPHWLDAAPAHPPSLAEGTESLNLEERRDRLRQWFQQCRMATLELFEPLEDEAICQQVHPDFSPVGWHLGHIGYTEGMWLLKRCAGISPPSPQYETLFAQDGLPKAQRCQLPPLSEIYAYLAAIREQVLNYLAVAPLDREERLWRFLLQHESQHCETIALVLQLQSLEKGTLSLRPWGKHPQRNAQADPPVSTMIAVPKGPVQLGSNALDALDNERPAHQVYLEDYTIDRYPVTCRDFRYFMTAGGYQDARWWSEEGWRWLQHHPVSQPLYWSDHAEWDDHPVYGVSWYEADAYARFVGKRLPTEAEWEKAARWCPSFLTSPADSGLDEGTTAPDGSSYPWGNMAVSPQHCNYSHWVGHTTPVYTYPDGRSALGCEDLLGNVWEWTADWFAPYPGFTPYPYVGYSSAYFDGQHRVLRGGSWATRPWALRSTFRNWYHPWVRQVFAGFRCAWSEPGAAPAGKRPL
ncbi:MAG: ergothioneine biosynthesis protein EgtB [Synechococcales bacterium]|nr:ergothioneine biosynthesis protein EgtB [Synechococcales bacterium]